MKKINKGEVMEELLRDYFMQAGYYVVRGVPFVYEGFDITDIDLWLYSRTSSISREITIVDIKNKKTPQAIERIFWTKGLAEVVGANNAIVASTEKRSEVKDFGRKLNITVLDGNFLSKLQKSQTRLELRISDEELFYLFDSYGLGKLDGDWKQRILDSKGLLSQGLNFDNCNSWINQAYFFLEQILTKPNQKEIAARSFYYLMSLVCIGIDFLLKELSYLTVDERIVKLADGFTYGSKGRDGMRKMIELSLSLVERFAYDGKITANQIRSNISTQFEMLPSQILGEYFSKREIYKNLFVVARELESLAMNKTFKSHMDSSIELKSMIFCFLDYWNVPRKNFSDAFTI